MAVRPRLLALSLVVAVAVSVPAGYALSRLGGAGDRVPPDELDGDLVLDTPGEFQQPLDEGVEAAVTTGRPLPDVTLVDGAGFEVATGDLRGAPAVINVWFSTCPPCIREMADFAAVHREVGDRVRFVGINPFDDVEVMQRFARDRGVAYELWRDTEGVFVDAVSLVSFPRTFFVDESGTVVGETGVLDAEGLRSMIEELF